MAENAGTIYFTVEADTANLISGLGSASKGLDSLDSGFGKAEKSAGRARLQMTKTAQAVRNLGGGARYASGGVSILSDVLKTFLTLKTAQALIEMANGYNEMTERVRMATRSGADLNAVNERLLDTANRTYRPLSEAAEVYIRAGSALSSMGKSTSDVLDITDSLSFAFVKNATSADRADAAIKAFTTSVNTGKVGAEAWQTILAAVPTVVDDIAAATGKSAAEVRALGVQGKLTADQLVNSLQRSLESNRQAADGMKTTVADAAQALRNNLTVAIGKVDQATGATDSLANSILKVAEAVRDSDIGALVREIDAIKISISETIDAVADMAGSFKRETDGITSYLPQSFERMALSTAKEIDGIAGFFQGAAGAISAVWGALAESIPIMFENAWTKTKNGAAEFVNSLADMVNTPLQALGMEGFGKVSFGGGQIREIQSLTEAAKKGWEEAAKGLGAYDSLLTKITDRVIDRSAQAWFEDYNRVLGEGEAAAVKLADSNQKLSAAQKQAIKDAQQNKKVIDDLATSLYLAGLRGEELAATKARMALNPAATEQEVAAAEALARALWNVEEAERNRGKFGDTAKEADQYIMGNVQPLSGGAFDEQYARYEAEAEAEQKRYDEQLERLRQARELQIETSKSYDQLEFEAAQQHADRMAQIEQAKTQVMLSSASQGFGALADIMKKSKGEQSGIYKAMFAASKAFAIADATVNAYSAISKAWNSAPFPANLAAVAATTPQVMSVVSAISGANYGGGRQYGGPVGPGRGYRINENGAPEILNMANGQQFLLPNSRGQVVSNKDATASDGSHGQPQVIVNLIENRERAGQIEQYSFDQNQVIDAFVADIGTGGRASQALEVNYGLKRRGL